MEAFYALVMKDTRLLLLVVEVSEASTFIAHALNCRQNGWL